MRQLRTSCVKKTERKKVKEDRKMVKERNISIKESESVDNGKPAYYHIGKIW